MGGTGDESATQVAAVSTCDLNTQVPGGTGPAASLLAERQHTRRAAAPAHPLGRAHDPVRSQEETFYRLANAVTEVVAQTSGSRPSG